MIGWWEKQISRPVQVVAPAGAGASATAACSTIAGRTGHVLATAYVLKGAHTLVSIASWANDTIACDLLVDWSSLGLHTPTQVQARAIDGFQGSATFAVQGGRVRNVTTAPAKGWLLVLGTYIPPTLPPSPPPTPPRPFTWGEIPTGGPGSGSPCPNPVSASSCIFDKAICKSLYGGQCGILEREVESKCGAWPKCAGAVCRPKLS